MSSSSVATVLVVDDEPSICWGFAKLLRGEGYAVLTAGSAEAGLQLAAAHTLSLVVLDVRLPGESGLDALPKFIAVTGGVPVIVITAFGDLETAVTAVRQGAVDYLTKPFCLEDATLACRQAMRRHEAMVVPHGDSGTTDSGSEPSWTWSPESSVKKRRSENAGDSLVGTSPAMQKVFRQIALVSASDLSVLITGETGTGKELVAAAIHRHSHRRAFPYLAVAPVSLSPSLLESELFGHVRGAFTGANEDRKGLFESAAGGTLLLDEIGDLPLAAQVKLLRVLEQRQFTPVGTVTARDCDVRILAATHRDLRSAVAAGTFREDLLYRMTAVTIELPPLRTRTEDIAGLARHFLERLGYPAIEHAVSQSLVDHLAERPWLGNIRELRNAVEHAAVIARGRPLDIADFPVVQVATSTGGEPGLDAAIDRWAWQALEHSLQNDPTGHKASNGETLPLYERFLAATEPALLRAVLNATQGNRAAAAQRLGMHRATLRERMKRYGFE